MATAPSDGYIYLIESDAVRNADWVTASADPQNIDLDLYTQGTEYCRLNFPKQWNKRGTTGINIEDASSGKSFMERTSRKGYIITIQDVETTGTNASYIEQFIMDDDHTASLPATFKQYYLIMQRSSTDYEKFTDASDNRQEFCKGAIIDWDFTWNDTQNNLCKVRLVFRSNW